MSHAFEPIPGDPGVCDRCLLGPLAHGEPTPAAGYPPRGWTPGDTYGVVASEQVREYFRTVKPAMDAEYPDPVDDELPDTDIRGAMAAELERMKLMPEQVDTPDCPDCGRQWADCRCEGPMT